MAATPQGASHPPRHKPSRGRALPVPSPRWSLTGLALSYLTVMLIIPLLTLLRDGMSAGLGEMWHAIALPIARSALLLTLWTSGVMAAINAVMGTLTAYVLVRYRFPGRALLNALVDLPLAIPTLVTGVMLVILFGPQEAVGGWLNQRLGIQIMFAPSGIILALLFITFPLVVRAVQPVIEGLDREPEAAAATLGARAWYSFRRITLPLLVPSILSGALLSFARAVGEFGAIVLVSGNIPYHTETAAVYVLGEIESQDQLGANAMSLAMLAVGCLVVVVVDVLGRREWGARQGVNRV